MKSFLSKQKQTIKGESNQTPSLEVFLWEGDCDYNNVDLILADLSPENTDWDVFRGSCGSVRERVIELMDGTVPREQAFGELCEEVSHQMSFYPAIYLAIPYMVKYLADHFTELDWEQQAHFIADIGACFAIDCSIIREHDPLEDNDAAAEIKEGYERSNQKLKLLTKNFLKENHGRLHELSPGNLSFFAANVLAIFGNHDDAFLITNCSMDEACYLCCEECEYVDEDIYLPEESTLTAITPAKLPETLWDGTDFSNTFVWYSSFLKSIEAERDLRNLTYCFGSYTCPECGKKQSIMALMRNYFING